MELPGYKIHGELGVGGQARVWLATQESFGRKVAIKALLPQYAENKEFAERFLREAKTVANLSHPHIIPVYDFGQSNGSYYMVMEYLPCGDLKGRIKDGLDEKLTLEILAQLASALHQAHEKGFVHRDVKPDNVMFREDGSAVLTDFGIARLQSGADQVTMVGQVLGTPRYMSPEQVQARQLDGRADIYSLGIMFYEMLSKRVPYDNPDFTALAVMHCKDPIPPLPGRFRRYQRLFERMVEKEPEKRFASALELSGILRDILSGKKDPDSIESSISLALKKSSQFRQADEVDVSDVPKQNLPREVSILLQELDPLLDADWYQKVGLLFRSLTGPQRTYAYANYLRGKGILHDKTSRKLIFEGRRSVRDLQPHIGSTALQQIVSKLLKAEEMLRSTRDAKAFADLMESSISIIENFDVQDSLPLQKDKQLVRQAFLDDLVLIVRGSVFQIEGNRRGLTEDVVRTFFIQVYLKQQMQGYRFRSTPVSALERHSSAFLRDVVAPEVKTRQCDIIRTDSCWFLVGPVRSFGQNPFSARRFLSEDSAMGGQVVYFNVVAIPNVEISNAKLLEHLKWSISRIVTLQRQLSLRIVELVQQMEQAHVQKLGPMLQEGIHADGTDLEEAIEKRMLEYEQQLSVQILAKVPKAVTELAKTQDDFEYLFHHLRQFIIQLACDVRDFSSQFVTTFSLAALELDLKMMSFLSLLDKRKDSLFVVSRPSEPDPLLDPELPFAEFKNVLDKFAPEIDSLKLKLKEVVTKSQQPRSAVIVWIEKALKLDQRRITPDMIQRQMEQAKKKCLVDLIRICKRYPKITVYVELEGLNDVDTSIRHYALPAGLEGVGQLPKLIRLYEDAALFNVEDVHRRLNFSVFSQRQKWGETNAA
ncbi:MAG: serine/threonine-protein kinase [Alcanivoracaceae bacterium]